MRSKSLQCPAVVAAAGVLPVDLIRTPVHAAHTLHQHRAVLPTCISNTVVESARCLGLCECIRECIVLGRHCQPCRLLGGWQQHSVCRCLPASLLVSAALLPTPALTQLPQGACSNRAVTDIRLQTRSGGTRQRQQQQRAAAVGSSRGRSFTTGSRTRDAGELSRLTK
jgi:hypothetical protein